jgi:ABC-type transporter Mla subunit MlaD
VAQSTRSKGEKSLQRLHESIEAAERAVKDVRTEMGRGSRTLLKDVEATLRDARKSLRSVNRAVAKDLQEVHQAARGRKPAPRRKPATQRKAGTSRRRSATKK